MGTIEIILLCMGLLLIVQICVIVKYSYSLRSIEKMIRECRHPFFIQEIKEGEKLLSLEKKVDLVLEEMMSLTDKNKNTP